VFAVSGTGLPATIRPREEQLNSQAAAEMEPARDCADADGSDGCSSDKVIARIGCAR
jgi:hypothetical protein